MDAGPKQDLWNLLPVIIVLLLGAAYFAVMETAFASASRIRLKAAADHGNRRAGQALYVLDLDMNQVNPTAAKDGSLLFLPLDDEAQALVHDLVKRHAEETGSAFAAGLLKDWKHTVARFTHVVPEHYLAMTAAMAKAEEDNIDFNTPGAWEQVYEQVMEGAH